MEQEETKTDKPQRKTIVPTSLPGLIKAGMKKNMTKPRTDSIRSVDSSSKMLNMMGKGLTT